jgi:predicted HTH transcriptional regulator
MNDPWNWTINDLKALLGQSESIRIDFKQSALFSESREKIAENLSKETSAFANTEGGVIVIGIAESKSGKTKIAAEIDEGLDISIWSKERIQQIIESNISPYLTSVRVRPIPLDDDNRKYAYSIYIPPGTTAYQASDHKYYGRSEYESKSLPDHEIRLRMFRGKTANAQIRVDKWFQDSITVNSNNIRNKLYSQADNFIDEINKLDPNQELVINRYGFTLILQNTGEINITEFKVRIDYSEGNYFKFPSPFMRTVKDGWPDHSYYSRTNKEQNLMQINIYPQDIYNFGNCSGIRVKSLEKT